MIKVLRNCKNRFFSKKYDSNISDEMLKQIWNASASKIDSADKEEIWCNIDKHLNHNGNIRRHHSLKYYSGIAALIALLICSGVTVFYLNPDFMLHNKSHELYRLYAQKGQKAIMKLSDGTIVWLNSDSKIVFDNKYNTTARIINLSGEAFFKVARNPYKKFIVRCKGINVEALGTQFNVKGYASDREVTTTLEHGKVRVSSHRQSVILAPMNVATYNTNNDLLQKSKVEDLEATNYWRYNSIVFNSEKLESIAKTIERMYNVKVVIKNKNLKNIKFSGTIRNKSLENILQVLSSTYLLKYRIEENVVSIYE